MNGVLNVYKEKGYTSFDVVAILRKILHEKKIGHTGTLDPDAEGVLCVCIGKATKIAGALTDTDKTYEALMQLGVSTDTEDISGKVIEKAAPEHVLERLKDVDLTAHIKSFEGEIMQVPPMYSALKVGGVKLVDAAREGKTIERKPRKVTIYEIANICLYPENLTVSFTCKCSKGTYIRTLCKDIGEKIGLPACLSKLKRIEAAGVNVSASHTLKEIEKIHEEGSLCEILLPIDEFFMDYPRLDLKGSEYDRYLYCGNMLLKNNFVQKNFNGKIFRIYDSKGEFCALYKNMGDALKCEKMFH